MLRFSGKNIIFAITNNNLCIMTRKLYYSILFFCLLTFIAMPAAAQQFKLNDKGYFNCEGVDVMAFDDIYPEGHQGGVSIIMNGRRIVTSGDIRL